jgi:hypothetical protein
VREAAAPDCCCHNEEGLTCRHCTKKILPVQPEDVLIFAAHFG